MSDFANQWSKAKEKFESNTGVKKPSEIGSKFGISYRKGTGIDSDLKDIDKLIPDSIKMETALPKSALSKLEKLCSSLETNARNYVDLLDTTIRQEKNKDGGKAASEIYRDLKILRSSLETIVASARLDAQKCGVVRQQVEDDVKTELLNTILAIRTATQSAEAQAKKGLLFAQGILKDPKVETFNKGISDASRDVTQPFTQFVKFGGVGKPNKTMQASREKALEDSEVRKASNNMTFLALGFKDKIEAVLKLSGGSALDASLSLYAKGATKLPENASSEDVIDATKNYIKGVKAVLNLAAEMNRVAK